MSRIIELKLFFFFFFTRVQYFCRDIVLGVMEFFRIDDNEKFRDYRLLIHCDLNDAVRRMFTSCFMFFFFIKNSHSKPSPISVSII